MNFNLCTALKIVFVGIVSLHLGGCTRDIGSETYASSHVGEAVETYEGVIVSKRAVTVKEGERFQDNTLGLVAGGVGGGILGSFIGGGRARALGALGGAALGAVGGAAAQQALSKQTAWEYTVKLSTGVMRTVVQGQDTNLAVGQKVFIQVSHQGRSRITPIN